MNMLVGLLLMWQGLSTGWILHRITVSDFSTSIYHFASYTLSNQGLRLSSILLRLCK